MNDEFKKQILDVFDQWLALYEHGRPVLYTPAREYASDAVKDCRDVVKKLLDAHDRKPRVVGQPKEQNRS